MPEAFRAIVNARNSEHNRIRLLICRLSSDHSNKKMLYNPIKIVYQELKNRYAVSQNKIAKIMRRNGLEAKSGRPRKKKPAKVIETQYIEENLIKNKFEITEPNYLWCSDISEFK